MPYVKKTHCVHGHALTKDNVRIEKRGRWKVRQCVTCHRIHALASYHKLKGKKHAD